MPRTHARELVLSSLRSTPNIGLGKPLMFGSLKRNRPRRQATNLYRFSGPDPRVSMAPNFKFKDFDFRKPDSGNAAVSSHPQPHNSFIATT